MSRNCSIWRAMSSSTLTVAFFCDSVPTISTSFR